MSAVLFMKVPYAHPRSQIVVFPRQVSERSSSPRQELFLIIHQRLVLYLVDVLRSNSADFVSCL